MSARLFVAIDLAEHVKDELFGLMFGIPGAFWSDDTQMHLTVRFLGELDGRAQRDVVTALSRVRVERFELQLAGVGYFPPRGPLRTLWAGVAPSPPLEGLRKWVDGQMTRLQVPTDRRKYVPHVTLARLSETPPARVAQFLEEHSLFRSSPFEVDAIHLYASQLLPGGPAYTHLEEFPLRGPPAVGTLGSDDEEE